MNPENIKVFHDFKSLSRSYLLKVTTFLVEISQFEFLIDRERYFWSSTFLSLNISDFDLFLCKNCTPLNKATSPLSQQPPLKVEVLSSPSFLNNWLELQPPPPPTSERGGCTLWLFNNFECMFVTVNLVFFLKLRTLWATLCLPLLLI